MNLIKLLICILLITGDFASEAWAEPEPSKRLGFGFVGGFGVVDQWGPDADRTTEINMMQVVDKSLLRAGSDTGIYGLSLSYGLYENLAIQLEVIRVSGGAKLTEDDVHNGNFKLSYLQIPILLRAEFSGKSHRRWYGVLGPALGFLIGAESENLESGDDNDVTNLLNRFDPGVAIGGGLAWEQTPRHWLTAELRYGVSFRTTDGRAMGADTIRNQSLSLLVGFRFGGSAPKAGRVNQGGDENPEADPRLARTQTPSKGHPTPNSPSATARPAADTDPDGDGITGKADRCPAAAEDVDGFQDEDGCPDLDNDGDKVPDVQDRCPDDRSRNQDGCSYARLNVEWSKLATTDYRLKLRAQISPDGSKDTNTDYLAVPSPKTLTKDAELTLADVAALLLDEPGIGLCIVGHADGDRVETHGKARARAVMTEIQKQYSKRSRRGLAPDRIEIRAQGKDALPFKVDETLKNRLVYFLPVASGSGKLCPVASQP